MFTNDNKRKGAATLEAILVIPVLVIVMIAAVEFCAISLLHQTASHAATVGASAASQGANAAEVAAEVDKVLEVNGLAVGSDVSVVLEDPQNVTNPIIKIGAEPCSPDAQPLLEPGNVRVTVCISMTAAPMVQHLKAYGLDFTNSHIEAYAVEKKE